MVFLLRLKREVGVGAEGSGEAWQPCGSPRDKLRGPRLQPPMAKDTSRPLPGAPDPC